MNTKRYIFDEIESCECIGQFEDEYVYDIEVDDDTHTFIANDILVHNSIYFCYEGLLNTIEGIENMSATEKTKILVDLNEKFLNGYNKDLMTKYYRKRNIRNPDTDMVHEFELETISMAEIRLDVKKRYSQLLIWKDGKYFDEDAPKSKTKGLEMVKASYPAPARKLLTELTSTLLKINDKHLIHILNQIMQDGKEKWMTADVDSISPAISVNDYKKYIISDNKPTGIEVGKGCPFAVRGLAYYNWLRQTHHLQGDPIYGGKLKYYIVKTQSKKKKSDQDVVFTFMPSECPTWAEQYAPIDRVALFQKCVIDPFNRILENVDLPKLSVTGNIEFNLFDMA